jgi:ABC-type branched-subunit amino acid transport system substrate-binding protein
MSCYLSKSVFSDTVHPLWVIFCVLVTLVGLTGCDKSILGDVSQLRTTAIEHSYTAGKDVEIAVVWHKDKKQFRDGAILAVEEINAEGGIDGHNLKVHFTEVSSFLKKHNVDRTNQGGGYRSAKQLAGSDMAHKVVARSNVAVVISADTPVESTLASVIVYQKHGLLVMNASSSNSSIDWMGSDLYFQLLPENKVLAKKIATEIVRQRWEKIFIAYVDTAQEREIIELVRAEFVNGGIELVGSYGMPLGDGRLNRYYKGRVVASLADLREGETDAIILLMPPKLSAQVIQTAREVGVLQPFFIGREFDAPKQFIDVVSEHGLGTRTTTLYRANDYKVKRFEQKFNKRFTDSKSDVSAMMGYDSVRLYAQGVAIAKTVVPIRVSESLNYRLPIWFGLLGSYSFSEGKSGNIDYSIQQLISNKDGTLGFVADDGI